MNTFDGVNVYDSELMQALRHKHHELKPALKKVSAFIQASPYRSATLNIEELAIATQTSTAAVNRLANALELRGFTGLRLALMENLLAVVSCPDVMKDRMRRTPEQGFGLAEQVAVSRSHLDNIARMNGEDTFQQMARQLAEARNVFVVGFGTSYHLAGMTADGLTPFCSGVHCVTLEGGAEGSAYRLAGIGARDILLAIALPAYTRDTLRLAQYARSRDASVLSLTDSPASPLADVSHLSLFVPPTHPVLAHSKVGLLTALEALIAQVRLHKAASNPTAAVPEDILACLRIDADASQDSPGQQSPDLPESPLPDQ